jgi:hypothetical protein
MGSGSALRRSCETAVAALEKETEQLLNLFGKPCPRPSFSLRGSTDNSEAACSRTRSVSTTTITISTVAWGAHAIELSSRSADGSAPTRTITYAPGVTGRTGNASTTGLRFRSVPTLATQAHRSSHRQVSCAWYSSAARGRPRPTNPQRRETLRGDERIE